MNKLKQFLGITLVLTIVWLLSIFRTLDSNSSHLLIIFASYVVFLVGMILYKKYQYKKLLFFSSIIISLLALFPIYFNSAKNNPAVSSSDKKAILKSGIRWEKWSPELTSELQANKKPTFIDFTADWCLTCKVNEKIVISSSDFQNVMKSNNVKMLLADWTKGDPVITKWLQSHNMAGVPAYFLINKKGKLINLGETITVKEVEEAF